MLIIFGGIQVFGVFLYSYNASEWIYEHHAQQGAKETWKSYGSSGKDAENHPLLVTS